MEIRKGFKPTWAEIPGGPARTIPGAAHGHLGRRYMAAHGAAAQQRPGPARCSPSRDDTSVVRYKAWGERAEVVWR
jgi:hypothetical protein